MESIYGSNAYSVNNENRRTEFLGWASLSGAMSSGMPHHNKQVSPLSSKHCVDMNHHHFNSHSGKRCEPEGTIAGISGAGSDARAGPLKKRAKLANNGGTDHTVPLAMNSMTVPQNLLPVSALTSAAAFLQPDMACQLFLSGAAPVVAPTTQQQMLADIIASEMELFEATARVKAAIAKKNQVTSSTNVPMTVEDPVATISASSSKDSEDATHSSMGTVVSSRDNEDLQDELRKPSARMVALHNYWVQARREPTLEP